VPNQAHEKWIKLYKAALLESDPSRLPGRIADARAALTERLEALRKTSPPAERERRTIEEALNSLQLLERRKMEVTKEEKRNQRETAFKRLKLKWPNLKIE
jgi:hypothetical protein